MRVSELVEQLRQNGVNVRETYGRMGIKVGAVVEDSRQVNATDVFVARVDNPTYLAQAMERGCMVLVTQGPRPAIAPLMCVVVDDAAKALGVLAQAHAGWPARGMTMIGVTGTKGKTTVAYLLRSVLKAAGKTVGMIGTVEIDDGKTVTPAEMTTPGPVELAQLMARMRANGVTHCVMEVSSHALHQKRVAGIDFGVAIFTNLTGDHLDYHKTMEEYAAAKALLFEGLKEQAVAVVNRKDSWVGRMTERTKARVVGYSIDAGSAARDGDWNATIVEMDRHVMLLKVVMPDGGRTRLSTPLVGKHNGFNTMAVLAAAVNCGVGVEVVMDTLREAPGAPGRLQRVSIDAPFAVFVDYAHTHDALENVLVALRSTMNVESGTSSAGGMLSGIASHDSVERETVPTAEHGTQGRLVCVFGCGGDRDRTKRPKMGAIAERLADKVIVTSDNPRTEEPAAIIDEICAGFSSAWRGDGKISVEADRRVAIGMAIGMATAGDVVLIAGKGHENYQIIGKTKHHFDDVEEATAAIERTLKRELQT